jgi:hypothetical protein
MAERDKQRAAQLHQLTQKRLKLTNRTCHVAQMRELQAVFPARLFQFGGGKSAEMVELHLRHCCPPLDSPTWESYGCLRTWGSLPQTRDHERDNLELRATAACDRRRKLLGVERLAPHACAELLLAAKGRGSHFEAPGWLDWKLLQVYRRVQGISEPELTCSDKRCGCTAVTGAPPLKLQLDLNLYTTYTQSMVDQMCHAMRTWATRLEAQGVPIDHAHLTQLLVGFAAAPPTPRPPPPKCFCWIARGHQTYAPVCPCPRHGHKLSWLPGGSSKDWKVYSNGKLFCGCDPPAADAPMDPEEEHKRKWAGETERRAELARLAFEGQPPPLPWRSKCRCPACRVCAEALRDQEQARLCLSA